MRRRTFLAGSASAALGLSLAAPARAQALSLNAISTYLNGLTTAETPFTQVNDDGTISTGRLFIHRPGRMRFEYSPPEDLVVLASGGQVAIFDGKSTNPAPEQYPLAKTPLKLILDRNVNLARAGMVIGHSQDGPKTIVRAQDPEHPEYGHIDLVFTSNPTELRQWVVVDDAGTSTTVILGALETGKSYPPSTFNISVETSRRGG
jgi:outer membrane lipoprotein-sorting protein